MTQAVRMVRLIQLAMLASIALYVLVGEVVHARIGANAALYYGVSFISISLVGAILVVRRTQVQQWALRLAERPDDGAALGRWKTGQIATYALCEALALLGLVLRVAGFRLTDVWPYYLGGFALMLVFWPRMPQREIGQAGSEIQ
jgi:hypothetical protein